MALSAKTGKFIGYCSKSFHKRSLQYFYRQSSSASQQLGIENERNPAKLFTDEHAAMQETMKKVIEKDINPYVDQWEAEGSFPGHKIFKILGNAGLLGVTKPTEYGGLGLDYSYGVAVAIALGHIKCGALPMAIGVQTDMSTPALAKYGSDKLKREFLAPAIAGDVVTSIAVSETGGGSDVASIKTSAVKKGDDLIINGSKMWITNAWQADWLCCLVNTGDGPVHKNKSLVIVPTKTPGVRLTKRISKMGMHASDTAEIVFEDVRVPQSHVIGQEGRGFMYQMMQFQEERLFAAASVISGLQICIDQTLEYTRERKVFNQPLLHMQTVHFRLAELQTEVECLRSLLYRATGQYVEGQDVTQLASMCKLKAGRLAREVTDSCLQFWGGMGFTNEVLVSRLYRDFRLLSIGGGADEVMLGIICKYMGSLPKRGF